MMYITGSGIPLMLSGGPTETCASFTGTLDAGPAEPTGGSGNTVPPPDASTSAAACCVAAAGSDDDDDDDDATGGGAGELDDPV